jgi:hypothetical protein
MSFDDRPPVHEHADRLAGAVGIEQEALAVGRDGEEVAPRGQAARDGRAEERATKDVPATDADLKSAASAASGTQMLRLVSVLPFEPEAQRGARVLLKGGLNRPAGEDPVINVTGLQPVGGACS